MLGQVFDKRLHIVIAMLRQSVEPAERTQPQWVNTFEMVGSGLTEPLPPDSPTRAYLAALARASSWAPPTGRTGRTAGTAARAALHGLVVLALPQAAKAQGQGHGFALQIHIADASIWNMLVLIIILLVMLLAVTFCRVLPLLPVGSPPPAVNDDVNEETEQLPEEEVSCAPQSWANVEREMEAENEVVEEVPSSDSKPVLRRRHGCPEPKSSPKAFRPPAGSQRPAAGPSTSQGTEEPPPVASAPTVEPPSAAAGAPSAAAAQAPPARYAQNAYVPHHGVGPAGLGVPVQWRAGPSIGHWPADLPTPSVNRPPWQGVQAADEPPSQPARSPYPRRQVHVPQPASREVGQMPRYVLSEPVDMCGHELDGISAKGSNQHGQRRTCMRCGMVLFTSAGPVNNGHFMTIGELGLPPA